MRSLFRFMLAAWLCLAGGLVVYRHSYAQSDGSNADTSAPADDAAVADTSAPTGPILQASDSAPVACDPGAPRFRYVEVRGTGFDAWATQHLVGNVVDVNGQSQIQWSSVWVSPQGGLTLEVNLCADPFRNRPALPVGNYTVTVGPGSGQPLAATSLALSPPPEPAAEGDQAEPPIMLPASTLAADPTPGSVAYVLPNVAAVPSPTPLPDVALSPSSAAPPTPGPQNGLGSRSRPFPLGTPGNLVDGWQLEVTGVTPDAWTGIHAAVPSTIAPASDQRDYVVRVQATFLGQGTGVFSGMRLALVSGIQTTYDQLHNSCGTVPDMVPPNLMTSGGTTRGNVCFTVRASDVGTLTMFDNESTDSDRVYFALQ